jgi:hypothetical protein
MMLRSRRAGAVVLATLGASSLAGCGAVLGLDEFLDACGDGTAVEHETPCGNGTTVSTSAGGAGGGGNAGGASNAGAGGTSTAGSAGGATSAGGAGDTSSAGGAGGASVCTPGVTESCYDGPAGTEGVGICAAGTHTCNGEGTAYGPCQGEVLPSSETCANNLDEDCNGSACSALDWG